MTSSFRAVSGTDRILLAGVEAFGYHGVLAFEKEQGQTFVVDVVLELDLGRAGRSDDLAHTVSYAEVATDVVARVTGPSYDLIERLAEVVADDCLARPLVDAVEVTVHKPQAPVGQPFSDVAVHVRRERGRPVVVALGANLGDAGETLAAAVREVAALRGVRVRAVSPLVETDPVGGPEQPVYLNAVLLADSTLDPAALLAALHGVEVAHGRTREVRWGARTLDLDLLQVGRAGTPGEVRSDDPDLTLPHPRAHERGFVLVPWLAADTDAVARDGAGAVRPVRELLADVGDEGVRPGPAWPGAADGSEGSDGGAWW
ncbi:2-amino-4-hydroxy-6-hydroxymethyldihydropteridine diphosphokinase [Lapillicoccus jejuensis]|uniref:Bifunctional folate synthesis protein n=1 Tax=Lapillicoccus jejuensis TaxID=402171 RepID=A0A542DXF7_9MICO|nr:2-amino-4-hydroxy-6-hydroxymethyldihydropteridine diphosphokinase [Lapillicoccus jejuensis]TQJ07768.1 dihydroneopterin aldolase/2-amino-4-hydroxy-6-hydroxymethyldihydropteridine diphosphokinase [Lapillicoccus jejuensis]